MPVVYILRSLKDKNLYVGYTNNLKRRLEKHKYGKVKATKNRRPLELVYYEIWKSRAIARRREKYLKSLYGYREKYRLIKKFGAKQNRSAILSPDKFTK
jgi:putative endonuclease